VALALGTALGDIDLIRRALFIGVSGMAVAILISCGWGYFADVDPTIAEIARRTHVGMGDVVLALASGGAAVLSLTTGTSMALVGV